MPAFCILFPSRLRALIAPSLLTVSLGACMNPPYAEGPKDLLFPSPPRPETQQYTVDGRVVHIEVMAGGPARVVFIHGTPGDWKAWVPYLADPRLRERATLIAVDRPGFGDSGPGRMAPALADQARLLAPLLRGAQGPAVVVGHSLGGPIAGQMAMDYPDEVRGAVLVAPSVAPELEYPRWYNRLLEYRFVQWLAPKVFFWSNEEILPLQDELRKIEPRWKDLKMPVTVIQGGKDSLVDPRSANFLEARLPRASARVIRVPDQGHFVVWKRTDLVIDAILDVLDRTPPSP